MRKLHLVSWAAVMLATTPALAEEAPAEPVFETMGIDFQSLPIASIPPLPSSEDPIDVSNLPVASGVSVKRDGEKTMMLKKAIAEAKKRKGVAKNAFPADSMVKVTAESSEPFAVYQIMDDAFEFNGTDLSLLCDAKTEAAPVPFRWETLQVDDGGKARLEVRDLAFSARQCDMRMQSTTSVSLKAVAFRDGKPWLYAARDQRSVTLIMPEASDISASALSGPPTVVHGKFTRVTIPLGRWGSGSVVGTFQGLAFGTTGASSDSVTIELVQTISEPEPTLLVRASLPAPEPVPETTVGTLPANFLQASCIKGVSDGVGTMPTCRLPAPKPIASSNALAPAPEPPPIRRVD